MLYSNSGETTEYLGQGRFPFRTACSPAAPTNERLNNPGPSLSRTEMMRTILLKVHLATRQPWHQPEPEQSSARSVFFGSVRSSAIICNHRASFGCGRSILDVVSTPGSSRCVIISYAYCVLPKVAYTFASFSPSGMLMRQWARKMDAEDGGCEVNNIPETKSGGTPATQLGGGPGGPFAPLGSFRSQIYRKDG